MGSFRAIKEQARRRLHDIMRVAAFYVPPTPGAVPQPLWVRVHTKWDDFGASGAADDSPNRQEMKPKLLFMLDEMRASNITLVKGGIISVSRGEAYILDNAEAPDVISVKWVVSQLQSQAKLNSLPVPE